MKHVVAINASPRTQWNTGTLVRQAARGAESTGSLVTVYDLYRLKPFTGCVSCFGCKLPEHQGTCICQDGLTPLLEDIRRCDGLILGTPNYLGDVSAAFRALYERLIFQSITYKAEIASYNRRQIPVLLLMTSNVPEDRYPETGYDRMLERYQTMLGKFVGPTRILTCGDTLQILDYDRYNWTNFDPEAKRARHEAVFPAEKSKAFSLGAEIAAGTWEV